MKGIIITRAQLIADKRWPDHDPGDEDEPSWLSAPVAPARSLVAAMQRAHRHAVALADQQMPFWFTRRP